MLDSTKELLDTVLRNDPSVTQRQRLAAVRLLEGKSVGAFLPARYRVLPREAVAELLSVSPRTVTNYGMRGTLKAVRGGVTGTKTIGFTEKSVRDFIARTDS